MSKLPLLTLLAGRAFALPAQAGFAIPAAAVTLNGSNGISHSGQLVLSGTGSSRTIQLCRPSPNPSGPPRETQQEPAPQVTRPARGGILGA